MLSQIEFTGQGNASTFTVATAEPGQSFTIRSNALGVTLIWWDGDSILMHPAQARELARDLATAADSAQAEA